MKTVNLPVYRNIALSKNRLYTTMLIEYICSVSSPLRQQAIDALTPLGLLIVKTLTNVL